MFQVEMEAAGATELATFELDQSPWPIVHGSRESLDNTKQPTPQTANLDMWLSQSLASGAGDHGLPDVQGVFDMLLGGGATDDKVGFSMEDANPVSIITERVSDTEQRLWTSGFKNVQVYRHRHGESKLELLAREAHGDFDFRYHGTYSLVARVNGSAPSFLVAIREQIFRFTLRGDDSAGYRLDSTVWGPTSGDPNPAPGDDKGYIVGLSLTEDGTLIACSKGGNVTAYQMDTAQDRLTPVDRLALRAHTHVKHIHISNSLATHGQGVFIVTQQELARVDFNVEKQRLEFHWSTLYGPAEQWYVSRLGPGSGSTPTVTTCQGRDLVVITDGSTDMALVYMDAETGVEVARAKINFGDIASRGTTSEQSVAVRGCLAFVVNNYLGVHGIESEASCQYAPTNASKALLSAFCNRLQPEFIVKVCPAVFGCTAYGVAMYKLEEGTRDDSFALKRYWHRDDLTCGTSIPLISDPPEGQISTTYCVGHKKGGERWGLLAMDSDSGEDVFSFPFFPPQPQAHTSAGVQAGRPLDKTGVANFFANPYYAGVEGVGGGALAMGSIGGVLVLTPAKPHDTAAAARPGEPADLLDASPLVGGVVGAVLFALVALVVVAAVAMARRAGGRGLRRRGAEDEDSQGEYHALPHSPPAEVI